MYFVINFIQWPLPLSTTWSWGCLQYFTKSCHAFILSFILSSYQWWYKRYCQIHFSQCAWYLNYDARHDPSSNNNSQNILRFFQLWMNPKLGNIPTRLVFFPLGNWQTTFHTCLEVNSDGGGLISSFLFNGSQTNMSFDHVMVD